MDARTHAGPRRKAARATTAPAKPSRPRQLEVEERPLESVLAYAQNARLHSEQQVEQIAASMKEFGFVNPVLVDADGVLIAGHGRILAARKLGMKMVPAIQLGHLTEGQVKALRIADNKIALNSEWDLEALRVEIGALLDMNYDTSLLGFDAASLHWFANGTIVENPGEEWAGMPGFEMGDKSAFRSLIVHFKDQAAVDEFVKATGLKLSEKTRFAWFPEAEIELAHNKRWETEKAK